MVNVHHMIDMVSGPHTAASSILKCENCMVTKDNKPLRDFEKPFIYIRCFTSSTRKQHQLEEELIQTKLTQTNLSLISHNTNYTLSDNNLLGGGCCP